MIANKKRQLKSGKQYDHLIPKPNFQNTKLSDLIEVGYTVKSMQNIVRATHTDMAKLAQVLKGKTITQTCSNIFNFVYQHIQYTKDRTGYEEIRTPARVWADRFHGVDCDCYSVFIGAILYNLNIPFAFRVTKYSGDWQHVYIIVYNNDAPNRKELKTFRNEYGEEYEKVVRTEKSKNYTIIDCVVDDDDYEVEFTDKQDHKMSTLMLSGIEDYYNDYGTTTVAEDLGALGRKKKAKRAARKAKRKEKRATRKAKRKEKKSTKKGGIFSKKRKEARKEKRATKKATKQANKRLSSSSLNEIVNAFKANRNVLNDRATQATFKQFLARAKSDASYKSELTRISTSLPTRGFWNSMLKNATFKSAYDDYLKNPNATKKKGLFNRKGGGNKKRGGIFSKFRGKIKERKAKRKEARAEKKAEKEKNPNKKGGIFSKFRDKRKKRKELKEKKKEEKQEVIKTNPNVTQDSINPVQDDFDTGTDTGADTSFDDFDTGTDNFDTSTSTTTQTNTSNYKEGDDGWLISEDGESGFHAGDWGSDATTQKSSSSSKQQEDPYFDTSEIEAEINEDVDFAMENSSSETSRTAKSLSKNLPILKDDFSAMLEDDAGSELDKTFTSKELDEFDDFEEIEGSGEEEKQNIFQKGMTWAKENPKAAAGVAIGVTIVVGGAAYMLTRPKEPISYQPYKADKKRNYKPRSAGKKKTLKGVASFSGLR